MSDTKLGQIIVGNPTRDAIHVAIAPVTAGMRLRPGDHVGLVDGLAMTSAEPNIGIVDPFLQAHVQKGQKFWLCLYQQTVTGMRHHWSHPAFLDVDITGNPEREASERWIREWASGLGITFEELMRGADEDDLCFGDTGRDFNDFNEEFWKHYAVLTGKAKSGNFFRCAC